MNSLFAGFIGFLLGYVIRHFDIDKAITDKMKQKIKEGKEKKDGNIQEKQKGE